MPKMRQGTRKMQVSTQTGCGQVGHVGNGKPNGTQWCETCLVISLTDRLRLAKYLMQTAIDTMKGFVENG